MMKELLKRKIYFKLHSQFNIHYQQVCMRVFIRQMFKRGAIKQTSLGSILFRKREIKKDYCWYASI